VSDQYAEYSGSAAQQTFRVAIDTNWKWLSSNVATSNAAGNKSSGTEAAISCYNVSGASAVDMFAPQAWTDIAGVPIYAATTTEAVVKRLAGGGGVLANPDAVNTTGKGSPTWGNNCPAITCTTPYTWVKATAADGSTVYIPAFK
jgi:hypothetical protein